MRSAILISVAVFPFVFPGVLGSTSAVAFDTTGTGFTSNGTASASWSHNATAGSYVVAQIFAQPTVATVFYGATPMVRLGGATVSTGFGNLLFYGLAGVSGPAEVAVTWGVGARDVVCNSVSYTGVGSVSATQGLSNQFGYSSSHGPIAVPAQCLAIQAFAGVCTNGGGAYLADYVGGTGRWTQQVNQDTTGVTSAMCIAGDSSSTEATFTANLGARFEYVWASYALTLSP